ncbi:two-component system, LytTR family, sensor histidine kinase AgrC [Enterococcus sp. AZ135]|uniref:sensor histidine kinase n=1 Tax=unclassified Enterococcus TaxID=2608891 RepID=UPI003F1EEBBE
MFNLTDFIFKLFTQLPLILVSHAASLFFAYYFLSFQINRKKILPTSVLFLITIGFFQGTITYFLSFSALPYAIRITLFSLFTLLSVLFIVSWVWLNDRNVPLYKILFLAMLMQYITLIIELISSTLLVAFILISDQRELLPISDPLAEAAFKFLCVSSVILVYVALTRSPFLNYLNEILKNRGLCLKLFGAAVIIQLSFYYTLHLKPSSVDWTWIWLGATGLISLFSFIFFMIYSRDVKHSSELEQSRLLLLQQQSYMDHLEKIQAELRNIQHDYKNMITGLYIHAKEGNTQQIQTYIESSLLNVDAGIQEEIKWSNQLANIASPELKGLLMAKMLTAKQENIQLNLEVAKSIDGVKMDSHDFIRCVGILLDNAIEATQKENSTRRITILLLQEEKRMQLVVKNPCSKKADLARIRNRGVSTKGSNRGLGLAIYQEITAKYSNILTETKQQNGEFIQELAIFDG